MLNYSNYQLRTGFFKLRHTTPYHTIPYHTIRRYMHPNGQIPAYEWALSDTNPPTLAWAVWRVYKMSAPSGHRDTHFLARCFQKLILNFNWYGMVWYGMVCHCNYKSTSSFACFTVRKVVFNFPQHDSSIFEASTNYLYILTYCSHHRIYLSVLTRCIGGSIARIRGARMCLRGVSLGWITLHYLTDPR